MTTRIARSDQVSGYELSLDGHLDDHWYDWVTGLTMTHEPDGTTTLRSPGLDQAALHGLLKKICDLGIPLISVAQIEPDQPDLSTTEHRRLPALL